MCTLSETEQEDLGGLLVWTAPLGVILPTAEHGWLLSVFSVTITCSVLSCCPEATDSLPSIAWGSLRGLCPTLGTSTGHPVSLDDGNLYNLQTARPKKPTGSFGLPVQGSATHWEPSVPGHIVPKHRGIFVSKWNIKGRAPWVFLVCNALNLHIGQTDLYRPGHPLWSLKRA